ncbi:MAG: flagellar protein FlgN [Phycisphaerales bacterium]|nr:flagellar protein FlgN [Phycisphaerales bacterium]
MNAPTSHFDHQRLVEALTETLRAQLDAHRELLPLLERKRDAIRTASADALRTTIEHERRVVRRLEQLERQRGALMERLAAALGLPRDATASAIAAAVGEPVERRLLALAAELREVVERSRRESSVLRAAADALAQHMHGVLQSVQGALSAARVYGRAGRIDAGAQLRCAVDLTS